MLSHHSEEDGAVEKSTFVVDPWDYLDPDSEIDPLPQPYRMIDKLLQLIIEEALDEAEMIYRPPRKLTEAEEADIRRKALGSHGPTSRQEEGLGSITCMVGWQVRGAGGFLVVGNADGEVLFLDVVQKRTLAKHVLAGGLVANSLAVCAWGSQAMVAAGCTGKVVLLTASLADNVCEPVAHIPTVVAASPLTPRTAASVTLAGDGPLFVGVAFEDGAAEVYRLPLSPSGPVALAAQLSSPDSREAKPAGAPPLIGKKETRSKSPTGLEKREAGADPQATQGHQPQQHISSADSLTPVLSLPGLPELTLQPAMPAPAPNNLTVALATPLDAAGPPTTATGTPHLPTLHFVAASQPSRRRNSSATSSSTATGTASGSVARVRTVTALVIWWRGNTRVQRYSLVPRQDQPSAAPLTAPPPSKNAPPPAPPVQSTASTKEYEWSLPFAVTASATNSTASSLALGLLDGSVLLWDTFAGTQKLVLRKHTAAVTALCFAHHDAYLLSTSLDATLHIHHVAASPVTTVIRNEHSAPVSSVYPIDCTPPLAVSVGSNDDCLIHDLTSGVCIGRLLIPDLAPALPPSVAPAAPAATTATTGVTSSRVPSPSVASRSAVASPPERAPSGGGVRHAEAQQAQQGSHTGAGGTSQGAYSLSTTPVETDAQHGHASSDAPALWRVRRSGGVDTGLQHVVVAVEEVPKVPPAGASGDAPAAAGAEGAAPPAGAGGTAAAGKEHGGKAPKRLDKKGKDGRPLSREKAAQQPLPPAPPKPKLPTRLFIYLLPSLLAALQPSPPRMGSFDRPSYTSSTHESPDAMAAALMSMSPSSAVPNSLTSQRRRSTHASPSPNSLLASPVSALAQSPDLPPRVTEKLLERSMAREAREARIQQRQVELVQQLQQHAPAQAQRHHATHTPRNM